MEVIILRSKSSIWKRNESFVTFVIMKRITLLDKVRNKTEKNDECFEIDVPDSSR